MAHRTGRCVDVKWITTHEDKEAQMQYRRLLRFIVMGCVLMLLAAPTASMTLTPDATTVGVNMEIGIITSATAGTDTSTANTTRNDVAEAANEIKVTTKTASKLDARNVVIGETPPTVIFGDNPTAGIVLSSADTNSDLTAKLTVIDRAVRTIHDATGNTDTAGIAVAADAGEKLLVTTDDANTSGDSMLTAAFDPAKTGVELLANYQNPFNTDEGENRDKTSVLAITTGSVQTVGAMTRIAA